jgi:hypothetical protein
MIAFLLLLAVPLQVPIDRVVEIASEWKFDKVHIDRPGAYIRGEFEVTEGQSGVRLLLIRERDLEAHRTGDNYRWLAKTPFDSSGRFHQVLQEAGDYAVIIENEDGRRPAKVHLKVEVESERIVWELPAWRRALVVTLSLGVFLAIAVYSTRKLGGQVRWPKQ